MRRWILKGMLGLSLLAVLSACEEKVKPGQAKVERPLVQGVTLTTMALETLPEYYETSGTVKSRAVSQVSSRVMGKVTALLVKEGDFVQAGQALLTLEDKDFVQKLKGALAAYQEATKALASAQQNKALLETTYQRSHALYEKKMIAQQELDKIATEKNVAELEYQRFQEMLERTKAGVEEAQIYHQFTKIMAPSNGIVTEKKIEVGSMAVPGTPLLTLVNNESLQLEIHLDETLSDQVKIGLAAEVRIESLGQKVTATISEIVPVVDPASRTFLAKINLPESRFKSGLYARVRLPIGEKRALLVPQKAIVERGQLTGIYTVNEAGLVTYRLIRLGKAYEDRQEVLSGLKPGERVITQGIENAADGGQLAVPSQPGETP